MTDQMTDARIDVGALLTERARLDAQLKAIADELHTLKRDNAVMLRATVQLRLALFELGYRSVEMMDSPLGIVESATEVLALIGKHLQVRR